MDTKIESKSFDYIEQATRYAESNRMEFVRVQATELRSLLEEYRALNTCGNDNPRRCEGCETEATTSDSEGVPLCEECAKACDEDVANNQGQTPAT